MRQFQSSISGESMKSQVKLCLVLLDQAEIFHRVQMIPKDQGKFFEIDIHTPI